MDEVYANTEEVLGCHRKFKSEHQTSEDIYMNQEVIQTVQHETIEPAPPGAEFVKKSSCRAAVILLGLLCVFLLIGLITVVFLFTQGKSQWEMETAMLHKLHDNVTIERNQLQTSYNILTAKQSQLQTSFNSLVKERDQLQNRLEDMTTNRDNLQRKLQERSANLESVNMVEDLYSKVDYTKKIRFQTNEEDKNTNISGNTDNATIYDNYCTEECTQPKLQENTSEDQQQGAEFVKQSSCRGAVILPGLLCLFLLMGLITLVLLFTQGKSQWEMEAVMLHKLVDNVTSERNQLQTSYNNLTTERDQLQTIFNNLTTERDQLQTIFNNLTTKHDQLQARYNNWTTERDQLQNRSNNLVKERDQLKERLENMTANRNDLQRQLQDYQQNWVSSSGSLYQVSSEQKSWEESKQNCLQKSAHLIIINSQEEQNFVNQLKKHLWIGLTDSQTEGTWKWVDGTQVNTSYWNQGNKEPNGGSQQNCGEIDNYNSNDSWNDAPCSKEKFWICEKRVSQ
ncbi:unnamed protein product [Oreochromis niloticus]|nr:unnamed protein product [Mustela putorius furo]